MIAFFLNISHYVIGYKYTNCFTKNLQNIKSKLICLLRWIVYVGKGYIITFPDNFMEVKITENIENRIQLFLYIIIIRLHILLCYLFIIYFFIYLLILVLFDMTSPIFVSKYLYCVTKYFPFHTHWDVSIGESNLHNFFTAFQLFTLVPIKNHLYDPRIRR